MCVGLIYGFRVNMWVFWISGSCGHPEGKIFRFVRLVAKIFR